MKRKNKQRKGAEPKVRRKKRAIVEQHPTFPPPHDQGVMKGQIQSAPNNLRDVPHKEFADKGVKHKFARPLAMGVLELQQSSLFLTNNQEFKRAPQGLLATKVLLSMSLYVPLGSEKRFLIYLSTSSKICNF